jgi:hypothetical protein
MEWEVPGGRPGWVFLYCTAVIPPGYFSEGDSAKSRTLSADFCLLVKAGRGSRGLLEWDDEGGRSCERERARVADEGKRLCCGLFCCGEEMERSETERRRLWRSTVDTLWE